MINLVYFYSAKVKLCFLSVYNPTTDMVWIGAMMPAGRVTIIIAIRALTSIHRVVKGYQSQTHIENFKKLLTLLKFV